MSKFILPTQKGTETFPAVMKAPTAVRIHGVEPHSEAARVLTSRFAAHINHFHVSQAQKYSLSTVENYRAHATYPGLKMTYTNLQGHETIDIVVADEVLSEEFGKKRVSLPDWCVINLHADGGAYFPGVAQLAITRDAAQNIDAASDMPFRHVAADGFGYGFDDGSANPLIAYPDPTKQTQVADLGTVVISSLKVDLRGLGEHGAVVYDLWGSMTAGVFENQPDGTYRHTPTFPYPSSGIPEFVVTTVFYTMYDLGPGGGPPRFVWVPPQAADWSADNTASPYHTHSEDILQHGLLVERDNFIYYQILLSSGVQVGGPYNGAGRFDYRGEYRESKAYYDIIANTTSVYVPKPVTSFLTFQFYDPGAQFDIVREGATSEAYWAAHGTALGTVVGTRFSQNIVSTAFTSLTYNLFGRFQQPLMGRVVIDRATRSVGFKPA